MKKQNKQRTKIKYVDDSREKTFISVVCLFLKKSE